MAKRRMFSTDFLQSNQFSDLPFSCQVLYFNLMASADDDGFISGPRRVMRSCNCTEEDLKYLVKADYLIAFDSGILVIRHWLVHNHIRKDRHTETVHATEKSQLELKNGVYDQREDADEKYIEPVEKAKSEMKKSVDECQEDAEKPINQSKTDTVCCPEAPKKTPEYPQPHQPSCNCNPWQDQASDLPKHHYFDDTQVNLLFQAFLCLRNEQTGRWDDPESIQKMVDQLNTYTPEQQQKLLQYAIDNERKKSCPENISKPETEKAFFSEKPCPVVNDEVSDNL